MISDQLGVLFASLDMTAMFSALAYVTWPVPVLVCVGVLLGWALRRLLSIRCSVVAASFVGVLAAAFIVGPERPELALAADALVGGDAGPAQSLLWAWSALLVLPAAAIRMSVDERRAQHAGNDIPHRGLRFFARVLRGRVAEPPAAPRGSWRLGVDVRTRERVEVDVPKTTTLIVGGAGQGKTNTVLGEVEAAVRNGYSVAFCDGKGSKDVALTLLVVAEALNVPFHVVSPREYGTPALDRRRRSLNVMADLSPEQVRDLVALAEEQTEPYYRNINKQGSRAAAAAIQLTGGVVTLKTLARALRQPEVIASALQQADAERFAEDVEWLSTLPAREKESLRALAGRLRNLSDGPAGDAITDGLPEVRLADLLQGGGGILYINAAPNIPTGPGCSPATWSKSSASIAVVSIRLASGAAAS